MRFVPFLVCNERFYLVEREHWGRWEDWFIQFELHILTNMEKQINCLNCSTEYVVVSAKSDGRCKTREWVDIGVLGDFCASAFFCLYNIRYMMLCIKLDFVYFMSICLWKCVLNIVFGTYKIVFPLQIFNFQFIMVEGSPISDPCITDPFGCQWTQKFSNSNTI